MIHGLGKTRASDPQGNGLVIDRNDRVVVGSWRGIDSKIDLNKARSGSPLWTLRVRLTAWLLR